MGPKIGHCVVEAVGYEVLLQVSEGKPADENKAADANSIQNKRIRIAGFYHDHRYFRERSYQ